MRIRCFQHVPHEDLGCIKKWVAERGHSLEYTRFFEPATAQQWSPAATATLAAEAATLAAEAATPAPVPPEPPADDADFLIVMGGPMSVHDEAAFPWLRREKAAIRAALADGKIVLGICLGAQLIADVLGAKITRNAHTEIGWLDVQIDPAAAGGLLGAPAPAPAPATVTATVTTAPSTKHLRVFQWHGETFEIPAGATKLASSAACANQAFYYSNAAGARALALQFHFEVTADDVERMLAVEKIPAAPAPAPPATGASATGARTPDTPPPALPIPTPYIQTAQEIAAFPPSHIAENNPRLFAVLDRLTK